MEHVTLVYMSLLGLAVGSFLNLNIDRIPRGQSIVSPPSQCDSCQRRLSPLDLVPLLSYLWLRGKCRYCGVRIPLRAFLVEVAAAVLFGVVAYRFGVGPVAWVIVVYGSLFLAISVIDLDHTIIPDKLVVPGIVLAFAAAPFGPVGDGRELGDAFLRVAAGGALGFGLMFLIFGVSILVYRSNVGFGFGDVKLGALIGLVVGFPDVLVAIYFAIVSGGVVAVLLLLLKLKGRRDVIPYGPFLSLGAVFTLLMAQDAGWYLELLR